MHCSQGMNRSVSIVLAYLMCDSRTRWTLRDAWSHVKQRRRNASPHHAYWEQLQAVEREVHGVSAPSISADEAGILLPGGTSTVGVAPGKDFNGNLQNGSSAVSCGLSCCDAVTEPRAEPER